MVHDRRRQARHIRGNVSQGGRYDPAEDKLHIEPEVTTRPSTVVEGARLRPRYAAVAPRGIDDAEIKLPDALPGALAENSTERKDEFGMPREKAEVRLPEATEEKLREPRE